MWEAREVAEDAKGFGRSDVVEELRVDLLDDGDGARSKPRAAASYATPPSPRIGLIHVALARPLLASDALVGARVADVNPDLDEDGAHARRVVDALTSALR